MSRDFQSLFSNGQANGGGMGVGNAIVANALNRLFFSYTPTMAASAGTETSNDKVLDIPYVAVPFNVTKDQLMAAAATISVPGQIVTASLQQIRNNQVLRAFAIDYAGAGQIQPPTASAALQASANGFSLVAGQGYEVAATYTDPAGTTPLGPVASVNAGLNMSVTRQDSIVYLIENDVNNGSYSAVNQGWFVPGTPKALIPLAEGQTLYLAPVNPSDGKQAGLGIMGIGSQYNTQGSTVAPAFDLNPAPYFSDGAGGSGQIEICSGFITTNGKMVRVTNIVTTENKKVYGGNDEGYSIQSGNSDGSSSPEWELIGARRLLRIGSGLRSAYLAVLCQPFWRPVGSQDWSRHYNFTGNNFPIASYLYANINDYAASQKWQEDAIPVISHAKEVYLNWKTYSQPLGLTNAAGSNIRLWGKNNSDQFRELTQVSGDFYVSQFNAANDNWKGAIARTQGSVLFYHAVITKNITNQYLDTKPSTPGPAGDEYNTLPSKFSVGVSVSPHANATLASFYIREVNRDIDGTLTRSNWRAMREDDRVNSWSGVIDSYFLDAVTLPATNTTNNYANSFTGAVLWDGNANEVLEFQVGDQFRLRNINHNFGLNLNPPPQLSISMEFTLVD